MEKKAKYAVSYHVTKYKFSSDLKVLKNHVTNHGIYGTEVFYRVHDDGSMERLPLTEKKELKNES